MSCFTHPNVLAMTEKPEWWKSLDPEIKRALRTLSTIAKVDKYGINPADKSENWMKDKYAKFGRKQESE